MGNNLIETFAVSALPESIRRLLKSAGLKQRKVLVSAGPGRSNSPVTDGKIVATLGGAPVTMVPFERGGGYETAAKVYVVQTWRRLVVLEVETERKCETLEAVAVAIDAALAGVA
jgi:hypothetical protein